MTDELISSKQVILLDHFFSDSVPLPNVLLQLTLDYIYPRHLTEIQNLEDKYLLRGGIALFGKTLGYEIRISNTEKSHILSSYSIDAEDIMEKCYMKFRESSVITSEWEGCCIKGSGYDPFSGGDYSYRHVLCPHEGTTYELQWFNYGTQTLSCYDEIRILQLVEPRYISEYVGIDFAGYGSKHTYKDIGYFGFENQPLSNRTTIYQYVQKYGRNWESYPLDDFVKVSVMANGTYRNLKN